MYVLLQELTQRIIERGKTSGRIDDNAETLTKRFKTFQEETKRMCMQYIYMYILMMMILMLLLLLAVVVCC